MGIPRGNPRCVECNGAGVVPAPRGWRACKCVRGTRAEHDAQRRMNSIGVDPAVIERNKRILKGE